MAVSTLFPYCTTGASNLEGSNWPDEGIVITPTFDTVVEKASSGAEQRRQIREAVHQFRYRWTRQNNDKSVVGAVYKFFLDCKGRYAAFGLFEFDCSYNWTNVLVQNGGTVVPWASSTTVNLLSRNVKSGSHVIKTGASEAAAVTRTLTTHYTIGDGTGTNGRDQLTMTAGSSAFNGHNIYHSWVGQRWFVVRFDTDALDQTMFSVLMSEYGLPLQELPYET